jgi:hypothetical protein
MNSNAWTVGKYPNIESHHNLRLTRWAAASAEAVDWIGNFRPRLSRKVEADLLIIPAAAIPAMVVQRQEVAADTK